MGWREELEIERKHVKSGLIVTGSIILIMLLISVLALQSGCAVTASLATWTQHQAKTRNRIQIDRRFGTGQDDRSLEQLRQEHEAWKLARSEAILAGGG